MSNVNKISFIEAVCLILIITINRLVLYLPQTILLSCGSSAILNVIYISVIAIFITFIIAKLYKRFSNSDIIDVSQFLGGKFFRNIVGIFLILYLFILSATLIRDFSEVIHILYYEYAPVIYLICFFIIVAAISNFLGEHSVVRTNAFLCIIMLISLSISFMFVVPNITIQRALPIWGHGTYQTFFSGLVNVFSYNGLFALYFIPPMLKDQSAKSLKKIAIISIIITSVLILFATISLLLSFSFSTEIESISPIYLLISNNELGEYFQHPESLFVLTWILSFMTYLNVALLFILRILKKITNVKNVKPFIVPICLIIFCISLIPKNIIQIREWEIFTSRYIAGPTVFIVLPLILLFANLKYKRFHKNDYDILE